MFLTFSNAPNAEYKRVCAKPDCDISFTTPYDHKKYCSGQCYKAVWNKRNRVKPRKGKCALPGCDNTFTTISKTRIYCSDECKCDGTNSTGSKERMFLTTVQWNQYLLNKKWFEIWRQAHELR